MPRREAENFASASQGLTGIVSRKAIPRSEPDCSLCLGCVQNVVQQAKSTLENANLTGVPQMRADMGSENMPPHAGFDMGQVLCPTIL